MKLILTLLVRDEEDIIRENILFHLNHGVDYIIATDNKSVDSTVDILRDFEKRGLLEYIYEPDDDYSQWRWVSRMARQAATKHGADWVINADADEFWCPIKGNLKEVLAEIPENVSVVGVERKNFVTVKRRYRHFYNDMIYREVLSLNTLGEKLPGKACHKAFPDVLVSQGNHNLKHPENILKINTHDIEILHFPMRSFLQFENKIKLGGAAYERNSELDKAIGNTWRKLFNDYRRAGLEQYYRSQVKSEAEIEKGLESGSLVMDKRLMDFFSQEKPTALQT